MRLSRHQKEIVKAIIQKKVYDIPSYLDYFGKWHLGKYDMDMLRAKFKEAEGGEQYKVIVDADQAYIKSVTTTKMPFGGAFNNETKIRRDSSTMPDSAWEYQEAEFLNNIKPVEIEYNGGTFSFDFVEAGVHILNDFEDIVEFMTLWSFLRKESLVLDVPRDVAVEDIGPFFELVSKEKEKVSAVIIHRDEAPESSLKPVERLILDQNQFFDHAPTFFATAYMEHEWKLNKGLLKHCEEYIGRKMLPNSGLVLFAKSLYATVEEWRFRIPLIVSIIALVISMIPVVQSWIPSKEPDHLAEINQKITAIETLLNDDSGQDALTELEEINKGITDISSKLQTDELKAGVDDLVAKIEELNKLLSSGQALEQNEE